MAIAKSNYDNPEVPRTPSAYRPDEHAVIKAKYERKVDGWIINYLINHGEIEKKGNGRYVFRKELMAPDPFEGGTRTDTWIMPVQLLPHESKHTVTTSPYIEGVDDEQIRKINPYKL